MKNMLKRQFSCIEKQKTIRDEIDLCIKILTKHVAEAKRSLSLTGITIFIHAGDDTDFFTRRNDIRNAFRERFGNLPVSVIAQPPLVVDAGQCGSDLQSPVALAMEFWTHDACMNLVYKQAYGLSYTVYEDAWGTSLWGLGLSTNDAAFSFGEQARFSFEAMQAILSEEGFTMNHLVRQWNYLPRILQTTAENGRMYQNYQVFNDIRQSYYGMYKQNALYPSATGIGMDCGTVSIDFLAVQPNVSTRIAGLNNPNQTNPCHYGQEVLIGAPLQENERKKAPLFERATCIGSHENALTFISGTASIIGEETVGLNDVAKQTVVTIDNLSALTSEKYTCIRVYVKHPDDVDTIRKICRKHCGNIPILYVKADICRDNLLVEIEGEAGAG
jgi:enamine deaminase RidA (YjgF/YER057c/UK114 family)